MAPLSWNESSNSSDNASMYFEDNFDALFYHYLWTYITPTIFSLIMLVGVAGNTLVLYVILSKPAMRTVTNLLLVNLACADLSFLLIGAPFTAYKYAALTWGLGNVMCKVFKYFTYVPACVTVYTLVAISAQRYTIIVGHQSSTLKTRQSVIVVILVIWASMLGINAPELYIHKVKVLGNYEYCGMIREAITPLFVCFFLLAYALPLTVICVLYISMMCHLRRKKRESVASTTNRDRTAHVARVVFTVVLVFGLSWLPMHLNSLVSLVTDLPDGVWYGLLRILWNCMAYGNSCANPAIYTFVSSEFRKAFREVVCCTRTSPTPRRHHQGDACSTTEMTTMVKTAANGNAV